LLYLYLDESGDLGFDFVNKKPSKFFTVTIMVINKNNENTLLFKGVKKTIRRKLNPKGKRKRIVDELKGNKTTLKIKKYFYEQIENTDFKIYAITLNKRRVYESLIQNKPRIYNFIARLVIDQIPLQGAQTKIDLIIDKSKSKPEILEFNTYIRRQLEGRIDPKIPLNIYHWDSKQNSGLQAVDMFSYGIFEKYERKRMEWFAVFKKKVKYDRVYLKIE
jgi:hypothetical protein